MEKCGCRVESFKSLKGIPFEISYCSLHSLAERMLMALKEIDLIVNSVVDHPDDVGNCSLCRIELITTDTIKLVEG